MIRMLEKRRGDAPRLAVQAEERFDFLSDAYASLYERSMATAFQSPLWLDHFYRDLVPALGATARVITIREGQGGDLVAVVPLVVQSAAGVRIAQPADLGVADCNAIVAEPDMLQRLARNSALRDDIRRGLDGIDVLIFRKVAEGADEAAALFGTATLTPNDHSAHRVTLSGPSFDAFTASTLSKSFRKGLERRRRRLAEVPVKREFRSFTDAEGVDAVLRFIRAGRTAKFSDDILHEDAYFDFYRNFAVAACKAGQATASALLVDGTIVAADLTLVGRDGCHAVLCASSAGPLARYAPGHQALLALMEQRYAAGDRIFDLGIGDCAYKKDMGAKAQPLANITVPLTLPGRLVATIYNHGKPLKSALRSVARSLR